MGSRPRLELAGVEAERGCPASGPPVGWSPDPLQGGPGLPAGPPAWDRRSRGIAGTSGVWGVGRAQR